MVGPGLPEGDPLGAGVGAGVAVGGGLEVGGGVKLGGAGLWVADGAVAAGERVGSAVAGAGEIDAVALGPGVPHPAATRAITTAIAPRLTRWR